MSFTILSASQLLETMHIVTPFRPFAVLLLLVVVVAAEGEDGTKNDSKNEKYDTELLSVF